MYSSTAGVEVVQLGLYIIRGDNMYSNRPFAIFCSSLYTPLLPLPPPCRAVIGEIDEEMEAEMNLSEIRAEPLNPVVH